jgi:hypothetical protein
VLFLAEFYLAGDTSLAEVADKARAGAEQAARAGATVSFVEAIFVAQDENCFAVYRARSADGATAAAAAAGIVLDRVSPAARARSVRRS